MSIWEKYGLAWVTLGLPALSLVGHRLFGWFPYADGQHLHVTPPDVGSFAIEMLRDTFENGQPEFLQLPWQVVGLALLLYARSPRSKAREDRAEALPDAILRGVDPQGTARTLREIDQKWPGQ